MAELSSFTERVSMNDKKTVILDLRDSPWVDGPGRTTLETATRIDREKYQIIVAGFSGGVQQTDEYISEAERRGLKVVRLHESGALDPRVFRQVLNVVDEYGVDIIHAHEFRSNIVGLFCARARRIPVITTCHGWIANNLKGRLRVFLDRVTLYFFDHIIVVSRRLGKQLNMQGIRLSRITVLSNAVAFEKFIHQIGKDDSFRKELGIDVETFLVANIGRLSPEKGQAEFIHGAAAVASEYPNVIFLLIGVGPDRERLEKLAVDLGIKEKIVFCGYRADMPRIYSSIDLVVQSSFTEGMPNVILEAAAMGVPVIATDVGGTAEIIEHNRSGVLVRPGVPLELKIAMLNFIKHKTSYLDMARQACLFVREKFSYETRTKEMRRIYDTLAKKM